MPYGKGKKLPTAARALPSHAQSVWRAAFNASFEKQGEEAAFAIAWAAVKNAGYGKSGSGKWVKTSDAEWNEEDHPRDQGGKFSDTSGGAGGHPLSEENWSPSRHEIRGINPEYASPDPENVSEADVAFMEEHGDEFRPVLDEMFNEYDINPPEVSEVMGEFGLKTPEDTANFIRDNYVGTFADDEDVGKNYIEDKFPILPQAVVDAIDMDALGSSLVDTGSGYFASYDSENDSIHVFRRPGGSKPARAKDAAKPLAFEVDSVSLVIGVNDDGPALVLDEGANVHRTADGYLAASPRIARTGIQVYRGWEMGVPERDTVRIYRPESEVFAPDSLRSYAHKPVTNDHPKEAVTSDNWRKYAVGHTADEILRDGGFIRIPLMISDADTVKDVDEGKIELSLGYTMELDWTPGKTDDGEPYDGVQRNIRANHLAIVAAARGGSRLRIGDANEGDTGMKTITIDGATVQVDDVAATLIPRHVAALEASVASLTTRAKTAEDSLASMTTKHKTDTETRDAEIVTLKKQVADAKLSPEQIETLVRDRTLVIGKARSVLGDRLVTDGRSEADIRRQVVDSAMGQAARGWSDDQVASSFAVLTKDSRVSIETGDGLAQILSDPRRPINDTRETAYDQYQHDLAQAHLPESRRTKFVAGRPGPGYQ